MLQNITEYLNSLNWKFRVDTDSTIISFALEGTSGNFYCTFDVHEEQNFFVFISFAGVKCPPEKRLELLQLFNRLNTYINYGDFEMVFDTGQMKFKTGNYFERNDIGVDIISTIVTRNINLIDYSLPVFLDLIYDKVDVDRGYHNLITPKVEEIIFEEENKPKELKDSKPKKKEIKS